MLVKGPHVLPLRKKINGHARMPNFYGTSIGIDSYVSGVYSINLIQITTIRWNYVKFIYIVDGRATQNYFNNHSTQPDILTHMQSPVPFKHSHKHSI